MKAARYLLLAAACLLLIVPAVSAQTTGNIRGVITDADGKALPGVTVEATSPNLQGTRSVVTGDSGAFAVVSVPPGPYKVRASLAGFGTVEIQATVLLDQTANVSVTMQLAAAEAVVVSGEAPLIDTTSTTTGTNYSAAVIAKLPVARNYAEILKSNPGVNVDRGETQGRALALSIYGATSVENQYIIDGVNTTNVIKGFQGKAINGEFIQEVEVKTGGYQAEYGRAMGGIINVITKSGGNEFHGDAFIYYDSFRSEGLDSAHPDASGQYPFINKGGLQATPKITTDNSLTGMLISDYTKTDFGVDLGGFLWKDRIWFFGAYDRVNNPNQVSRQIGSSAVPSTLQFPLDETDNLYSAKLTFNILQGTSLVGTYFADPSHITGAAGSDPRQSRVTTITSTNPRTWQARRDVGGTDYGIRLNQLFGSMGLATFQYSRHHDRYLLTPSEAGAGIRYNDFTCTGGTPDSPCVQPAVANSTTGGFGSIFGPTVNNKSKRDQYRGDFTFYMGNNELKVGGDYMKGTTDAITYYTGGGEGGYPGGQAVTIGNEYGQLYYEHDFFAISTTDLTPVDNIIAPSTVDYGAYIQDSLKLSPSFTINAGLRWDEEKIKDWSSTTVIHTKNEWQPRLGFVWDPKANGQAKIYGFWGRFYYALPTDINVRAYGQQTQATTWNFDPVSVTQDPNVIGHESPFTQGGAFTEPVEEGIKGIYQDEYTLGGEMLLDPTFSIGLKGTYRNLGRALEDRCDLDGSRPETNFNTCAIVNVGADAPLAQGLVPGCNGLDGDALECTETIPPTPKAVRKYWGGEVLVRKSFTQALWLQASFVYSSLRGNYDGEVRQGRGQTDPGINADYDYYYFNYNNDGKLFLDRPVNFRLDASYTLPFNLFTGVQFFVQSGAPLNKQGYFNSGYGAEIQLVERGTAKTLPTLYELNMTLGYPVKIGPVTVTLQAFAFNLLNRQQRTLEDVRFSTSQPAGYPDTILDPNQQQTNTNYGKITTQQAPRLFRFAAKVSF
ncbi:MAG: TonB-dependent receptor [Thermoanaerobaculia bacterium]